METTTDLVIEKIFSLYERYGDEDYIGEPISQLEHMSQSAQLAIQEGYDDEVVLAAFFHDIGHICSMEESDVEMGGFGVSNHEKIGANFLRKYGFPEKIALLVENHVQAKRHLMHKHPDYIAQLSDASRATLEYQGGKMDEMEAKRFEKNPLFEISILLRKWDEMAKEKGVPVIDLSILKNAAKKVLNRRPADAR